MLINATRRTTASLLRTRVNHRHQFLPGDWIVTKTSKQPAGDKIRALLVDATVSHAVMCRLDHHTSALRLQNMLDAIGDLRCQAFLNLQPLGIRVDYAS